MRPWLLASFALLCSCARSPGPAYVAVHSDTKWSGSFGNRTVDGEGNDRVYLPTGKVDCVVVQKQTESGFLRVSIWRGEDHTEPVETTARYGVVTACER